MAFKNKKEIMGMYILYIGSIIMNLIPVFSIASMGALIFIVTFIANYILKFKCAKDTADYNHYAYMTKTIWIFSFLVLIGLGLSYFYGDHSIILNIMKSAQSGVFFTDEQIMSLTTDYMRANVFLFIGYFMPVTFYLIYRMGHGFYKSTSGKTISNLKSWL